MSEINNAVPEPTTEEPKGNNVWVIIFSVLGVFLAFGLLFLAIDHGNASDGYQGNGTIVKLSLRSPSCFVHISQDGTGNEQTYQEGSYECFSRNVGDRVSIKNGILFDITEAK